MKLGRKSPNINKKTVGLDGRMKKNKLEMRLGGEFGGRKGRHRMRLGGCTLVGERTHRMQLGKECVWGKNTDNEVEEGGRLGEDTRNTYIA